MSERNINESAMKVILNAGDGRILIDEAIECMTENNFEAAKQKLEEAEKKVLAAHVAQTEVIQGQVSGEDVEYSLLFIHAQDTIMTINSELRIISKLLPLFENMRKEK